jgi:putative transposase
MGAVQDLSTSVGVKRACQELAVPRASYYRQQPRGMCPPDADRRCSSARRLREEERAAILACLHEERFQDGSPAQVYASWLDEGQYHCSLRTMYRLLAAEGENRERRDQCRRPPDAKPELLATAPHPRWSWDMTKRRGPAQWTFYDLYLILDVFSRSVTGCMIAYRESAD